MSSVVLQVTDLQLVKGRQTILDIPFLSVTEGEVLVIMGPNGAGKTTLLQVLAALQPPTTGTITFRGYDVTRLNPVKLRRRMAVVFQEPLLLDTTVYENVAVGLKIRGVPRAERHARVEKWLDRLGISGLAQRSVRYLSGGEAQRVSLARAFVLEPEVLFMDEPFSALDRESRLSLLEEIGSLLKSTRLTTVFVTHRQSEALMLADSLCFMEAGRIVRRETVGQFQKRLGPVADWV